jgi:hypothetical protein
MLVAYGPDGNVVIAGETPPEQLQQWSRERSLHCPNCRGVVHMRGGTDKRTQVHFAHQKGECAWSTEAESVRHMRGKVVLANWLRAQFPQATITLEERLPEPNRIADIFVAHEDGRRWAIEFQCAPLDIEEWQRRHDAYRQANILDIWIVGNNRRDKQEAFIEAILTTYREVLFLDPLVEPPRVWLRWAVSYETVQVWQPEEIDRATLAGWVGRLRYGATLVSQLGAVRLDEQGRLLHPERSALERRALLIEQMGAAPTVDEAALAAYLRNRVSEKALRMVILPLTRAYLRDPDLLRRFNYGRGLDGSPVCEADVQRIERAKQWLASLAKQGFTSAKIYELVKVIPFAGPYAALANYAEMLLSLE